MRVPVIKPLYLVLKWCGFPVIWETSIGAILFHEKGREREYLLLHYPSGHFDFVKGHVEENETEDMTLRRETEEETGIKSLTTFPFRLSTRFFYVARGNEQMKRLRAHKGIWIFKQVHFYPAKTEESVVMISHEHTGFLWLPYKEALAKVTFENARRILTQTEEYLNK